MNDRYRECYGIRAPEAVSGYICKLLSGLLPCDLLLDVLFVGLSKQVEETAREVVGVGVRVPQLIGDAIEEQVP